MISGGQEVVSHNMETVERLYRRVRPQAKYERSLQEIQRIKDFGKRTKSGIMLGLGETRDEVLKAMDDLVAHGRPIGEIIVSCGETRLKSLMQRA